MAYHDVSIYGDQELSGDAKEFFDNDCIGNSLVMWLTSKRGDFIMSPTTGGILGDLDFKLMSNLNIELLIFKIQTELALNFSSLLTPTSIQVLPNYTERYIEIKISYSVNSTQQNKTVSIYIDTIIKPEKFVYEDISYTSQNLESFVLVTKSTMQGKILQWNFEESAYTWGRYKFINLNDSDPSFSFILAYCNDIV